MLKEFFKKTLMSIILISILFTYYLSINAVTVFFYLDKGQCAIWLNSTSEGYEIEVGAFGRAADNIDIDNISRIGDNKFIVSIGRNSMEADIKNKSSEFHNYKFKLGKLKPGQYEFLLRTSHQFYSDMFIRRFKFSIPNASVDVSESDNTKIDLDVYKGTEEYNFEGKLENNIGKVIICVPLVYKEKEYFDEDNQDLKVFIYDEKGKEVSEIDDFKCDDYKSLEQMEQSLDGPRNSNKPFQRIKDSEEFKKNAYKYLRMNYAKIELQPDKLYHIKAIHTVDGKEYIKEMNYHNINFKNLKEEINIKEEYVFEKDAYYIKADYNKVNSCDEYELYAMYWYNENMPLEDQIEHPNSLSSISDFILKDNSSFIILGKKGDKYISRSKVFKIQDSKIKIYINGSYIKTDTDPVIINSRVLVPIRVITESFGGTADWDNKTKTVNILVKNKKIQFRIGNKRSIVDDKEKLMEVSPTIINNRAYIPLRFLAENMDYSVDWNNENRIVIIN